MVKIKIERNKERKENISGIERRRSKQKRKKENKW